MHHLPAIDQDSHRLPLADSTLLRLAEGLLCEDASQRIELLQQAIFDDAALALWCVLCAWSRERQCLESASDAACWLGEHGLTQFTAVEEATKPDDTPWTDCVRESIARRAKVAEDAPAESQFKAMLSNIGQWQQLVASAPGSSTFPSGPEWLAEFERDDDQPTESSDEVNDLVTAWKSKQPIALSLFQRTLATRQTLESLQQHWDETFLREKLASLKEFTYGASHELNNPLFNISSRAQVLLRDEQDPERRRKLSTIYAHAIRASDMINDIALAARIPHPEYVSVDLVSAVNEVAAELRLAAEEQATLLVFEPPATSLTIDVDSTQLAVAVREVIINALESLKRSTRRGKVTVIVGATDDGHAEINIADNGPGMDARSKRHLFDPFFSSYEAGRGLGFGLTKCWQIVQAHGGTIVVDSQPERGTTFTLRFPMKQSAAAAQEVEATRRTQAGN